MADFLALASISETRQREIAAEFRDETVIEGGNTAMAARQVGARYSLEPDEVRELARRWPKESR